MKKNKEEKSLLSKLASGSLDGNVGSERVYQGYKKVYCGKFIRNGVPVSYRQGESTRFFDGMLGKRRENDSNGQNQLG